MNIVITGAAGFIGRHVVTRLIADGHNVLGVDVVPFSIFGIGGCLYHRTDLRDAENMIPDGWIAPDGSFTLVHLAWNMNRNSGYAEQVEMIHLLATILDYWSPRGLCRLVAMGSAEEYGDLDGCLKENDCPEHFVSPYGWAKAAASRMVKDWSWRTGVASVWLRPFIVYGSGQGGEMLLPYAIRCAKEESPAEFSDGEQMRDFVHVRDVAGAVVCSIGVPLDGAYVFNVASGCPVKVLDVLHHIAQNLHASDNFRIGARERRTGEPDIQYAEISNLRRILKWNPTVAWQDGIDELCYRKAELPQEGTGCAKKG